MTLQQEPQVCYGCTPDPEPEQRQQPGHRRRQRGDQRCSAIAQAIRAPGTSVCCIWRVRLAWDLGNGLRLASLGREGKNKKMRHKSSCLDRLSATRSLARHGKGTANLITVLLPLCFTRCICNRKRIVSSTPCFLPSYPTLPFLVFLSMRRLSSIVFRRFELRLAVLRRTPLPVPLFYSSYSYCSS